MFKFIAGPKPVLRFGVHQVGRNADIKNETKRAPVGWPAASLFQLASAAAGVAAWRASKSNCDTGRWLAVWPDLAKFCNFGTMLKHFVHFESAHLGGEENYLGRAICWHVSYT